jgi:anaerobic selenocysteine-containing dehydrogenase
MDSANLAALWGMLMTAPGALRKSAARAGFTLGPAMGEEIFQALMDHPEGMWIGKSDEENNLGDLRTASGLIELDVPEMQPWLAKVQPADEERELTMTPEFPLILNAGRHMDYNANTQMRDPAWNKGKRACTLAMHPDDARDLGLADGDTAQVTTTAGSLVLEVEIEKGVRPGTVIIPHGFGLDYNGRTYGVNVNQLTPSDNRDPLAGTPLHRFVPCRVEKAA